MKKIAILYPAHFEQAIGGAELQISYLVKYLKLEYEIHYIFCDNNKPIKNVDNIVLHPLKRYRYKLIGKAWFLYKRKIFKLLNIIKPEVIYTRLGSSWIYYAEKYRMRHDTIHVHAIASDYDLTRTFFKNLYPIGEPIESHLINRGLSKCKKIIVQNNFQKQTLLSRFNKESLLINQMTPLCNITIPKTTSSSKIKILWVANLKPSKRPELFIELCDYLRPVSQKIECYIIGASSHLYSKMINDALNKYSYLSYLGQIPQNDVLKIFEEADILVNTSSYEGFSNTYVQAWMRGCIVMALEANPDNIITNYNIGFVNKSIPAIADKIKYLINNRDELNGMCKSAHEYATNNHSVEMNIIKILKFLNSTNNEE